MAVMAHSTVGLQHAAMANLQRLCRPRRPRFIILGNTIDAAARRPGVEWYHSAQDAAAMVRDYPSGTICRSRCRTSPNPPCALTRSR